MASDATSAASASYNPAACCDTHCYMYGVRPSEPCWGDVLLDDVVETDDGGGTLVHACRGHKDYRYEPESPA